MKKIIISAFIPILLLMAMPAANAQHAAVRDFYKHYKGNADVHHINIDGAAFKLAKWVISWDKENPESQMISRIAKNLKGLSIIVVPKRFEKEYTFKLVQERVRKDSFSELMDVRESGSRLSFYAQGEEKEVRDMIIFIDEDENYSIISVKGVLNMDDLMYLAQNHGDWN